MTDKIPLVPNNWRPHRIYLPPTIKNGQKYIQSKYNNYDNIFGVCMGESRITSSDIDGFYHFGNRNTPWYDHSQDRIVLLESKWGAETECNGQFKAYVSMTYDPRVICLFLYFDNHDTFQDDPVAYTLIQNEKIVVQYKTIKDKTEIRKIMQEITNYCGVK